MKEIFDISINQITKFLSDRFSKRIALIDLNQNTRYTYIDLHIATLKYSNFFSKYLIINEDIVYINSNSVEHIFLFFTCLQCGYRFVPINPKLKEKEIILMLKQIKPKFLIYGEEFHGDINIIAKELKIQYIYSIEELKDKIKTVDDFESPKYKFSLNRDVLILFTSGTTGIPKPARISIRMILYNVFHTVMYWNLNSNDSTTIHTPMFHAGGLNVLTTPLLFIGGRLYLMNKFSSKTIFQLIALKKINLLFAVPTMFKMMIDSMEWKDTNLENMKLIISGGAPCPEYIFDEFSKKNFILKQGFGMTEVGVNCFFISNEDAKHKVGSVGKPMFFLEVNLVDENNNIVESEGTGVMWFKGPVVFNGYEGYSLENTFDKTLGFCSGDIAYRDKDGYYWIKGRIKDIIIRGGENIYPSEIEKEVYNFSWVDECSLIAMRDDFWGEIPILCLTSRESLSDIYVNELYLYLKRKLASYKLPHKIFLLNEFPRSSTGKILKGELQNKINNNEFLKVYIFK